MLLNTNHQSSSYADCMLVIRNGWMHFRLAAVIITSVGNGRSVTEFATQKPSLEHFNNMQMHFIMHANDFSVSLLALSLHRGHCRGC